MFVSLLSPAGRGEKISRERDRKHSSRLLLVLLFLYCVPTVATDSQTFALTFDPDTTPLTSPPLTSPPPHLASPQIPARSRRGLVVSDLLSRFSSGCLPRSAALTRFARPAGDVACHTAAAESG